MFTKPRSNVMCVAHASFRVRANKTGTFELVACVHSVFAFSICGATYLLTVVLHMLIRVGEVFCSVSAWTSITVYFEEHKKHRTVRAVEVIFSS